MPGKIITKRSKDAVRIGAGSSTGVLRKTLPQSGSPLKRNQGSARRASLSEDMNLWEVLAKYLSLVDIETLGGRYTDMCDMMIRISQIELVADPVYPCGPSASYTDGPFIFS